MLLLRRFSLSWPPALGSAAFACRLLAALLLFIAIPAHAQDQNLAAATASLDLDQPSLSAPAPAETRALPDTPEPQKPAPGSIHGSLTDTTGVAVPGARVRLSRGDQAPALEVLSDENGEFLFPTVDPGPFQIAVISQGFANFTTSGTLAPGGNFAVPQITLTVATNVTEVRVTLTTVEIAQEQLKDQEQQRVFGFIPNFYVSYVQNAAPLTTKQKFQLAWKTTIDPVSFLIVGASAGVEQATDQFGAYGQGAEGYGKRYGAAYADFLTGVYIGSAILPSVFKQDPRYFYKGTGTVKSRALYAIANAVISKGDNGKWQPAYASLLGSLAAGGISNALLPRERPRRRPSL